MAARHTNLGLLVLLAWALATGGLAFAVGAGWEAWIVAAHGAAGLGLLVLAPWKAVIARRGLRRRRGGSGPSLAFAMLVAAALAAGIGHATGLLRTIGPVTAMQVHVAAAIGSIPLFLWHVAARPVRPRPTDLSRRTLVRSGLVTVGSVAAFGGLAGVVRLTGAPGRRARATGSFPVERGSDPVTQWLTDGQPVIEPSTWGLELTANGRTIERLTPQDLEPGIERVDAILDCTGGWFVHGTWEGIRLDRLLAGVAGPDDGSIRVVSVTGYSRRFPLGDASRLWLATLAEGMPLSPGHGAPARIVAPGRRGFWWVKWVASIGVDATPWWWQPPFPTQ